MFRILILEAYHDTQFLSKYDQDLSNRKKIRKKLQMKTIKTYNVIFFKMFISHIFTYGSDTQKREKGN